MGTPAGMCRVTFHLETGDNVFVLVIWVRPEQVLRFHVSNRRET